MTSFIIIALLITLITLGLLIWPLRKNRNSISYARQAQNIHFAKERIQELDEQLQNASISATDYEALKLEIENTLADDIDIAKQNSDDETALHTPKSNKLVIALLSVILPVSALGFYYFVGTPESFSLLKQGASQQNISQAQQGKAPLDPEVTQMLIAIEERLKEKPDDAKGWELLSSTYLKVGRYDDAKRSLINLMRIRGESAELLTSIADVTARAARGSFIGEPQELLSRALAINPEFPQALWMIGLASAQSQDRTTAIKYWNQLVPLLNDSPQQQEELRQLIQQAEIGLAKQQPSNGESAPTVAAAPIGNQIANEQTETNKTNAENDASKGISVSVSIAPSMLEKAKPTDLVFVIAKATQGPPAPLAVKRLTVADLPTTINLKDTDAMLEQFKLSLFENVSISARVARSGNPVAQNGDLQSNIIETKNNTDKLIELEISSEITGK